MSDAVHIAVMILSLPPELLTLALSFLAFDFPLARRAALRGVCRLLQRRLDAEAAPIRAHAKRFAAMNMRGQLFYLYRCDTRARAVPRYPGESFVHHIRMLEQSLRIRRCIRDGVESGLLSGPLAYPCWLQAVCKWRRGYVPVGAFSKAELYKWATERRCSEYMEQLCFKLADVRSGL